MAHGDPSQRDHTQVRAEPARTREPASAPTKPEKPSAAQKNRRRRALSRFVRRGLLVLFAVVVVAGLVVAWMPEPVPVEVGTVTRGTLRVTVDEDGRTRVIDRYSVAAPLSGNLARIDWEPGDAVKRGAVLARITPAPPPLLDERTRATAEARLSAALAAERQARAQIARAEARAELARSEAERDRKLMESGAISSAALQQSLVNERSAEAELESLRFGVRVAEHEVQTARAALLRISGNGKKEGALDVTSPIDGSVLRVVRENAGPVQAGEALLELGEPNALEVVVDVLSSDAVRLRPGAEATIEAWGGAPLAARVRRIEPSAFTRLSALGVEEQRVNVILDITDPREKWTALGDGFRVEARIVAWEGSDLTLVPASAVFRRGEDWVVFRIDEESRAQLTPVEIGERTGRTVQIVSGLSPGARVILHPSDQVETGTEVAPR